MSQKKTKENLEPSEEINDERQFKCKCKKIYKSYPALYTHIKNKHPDKISQYKNQSKKPKQGQTEKGRPKKHRDRPMEAEEQGQLLNIIELGILDIQQTIRKQRHQPQQRKSQQFQILQGNSQLNSQDLLQQYKNTKINIIQKILHNYQQSPQCQNIINKLNSNTLQTLKQQKPIKIYKQQIYFRNQLIQHFPPSIASKILIQLQIIQLQEYLNQNNVKKENRYQMDQNDGDLLLEDQIDRERFQQRDQLNIIQNLQKQLWKKNNGFLLKECIRTICQKWNQKLKSFQNGSMPNKSNVKQMKSQASLPSLPSQYESQQTIKKQEQSQFY